MSEENLKGIYDSCVVLIFKICATNQDKNLFELLELIDIPNLNQLSMVEKLDAITMGLVRSKYTHPKCKPLEYTD